MSTLIVLNTKNKIFQDASDHLRCSPPPKVVGDTKGGVQEKFYNL